MLDLADSSIHWFKHFLSQHTRLIHEVKKTQHQNWLWSYTGWDFLKKPVRKYISIQLRMKLKKWSIFMINWVSSCLSFFLSACTAATYFFFAPTCTSTMITLKPWALHDEIQHFILRFNKFHYIPDTTERHIWGLKGCPKVRQRHGAFPGNFSVKHQ